MPLTEATIRDALSNVKYPGFSRDILSFGLVKAIDIDGGDVTVKISLSTRDPKVPQQILEESQAALDALSGVDKAKIDFDIQEPPQAAAQGGGADMAKASIPGVKCIIAVASGKGGVGKSTVATNLAVALAKAVRNADGASAPGEPRVGICDCDLYGPSVALMMGAEERPLATEENNIVPLQRHDLKFMSMGSLLDDEAPVIVRGPMATRYTQQFLRQVEWGELDFLILDLPPGTGDVQLTIVQTVSLDGAIIVTTPQEVALIDARRAVSMFAKVNVPILGIIENMSYFECPSDGKRYDIFGKGGGAKEADRLKVPLLGEIPIDIRTREQGDNGAPIATFPTEESAVSAAFHQIAEKILAEVSAKA